MNARVFGVFGAIDGRDAAHRDKLIVSLKKKGTEIFVIHTVST